MSEKTLFLMLVIIFLPDLPTTYGKMVACAMVNISTFN